MKMRRLLLCFLALLPFLAAAEDGALRPASNITVDDIVARLQANNRRRQQELQSYTGEREYHLLYTGFPGKREADLVVDVKYDAPGNKNFSVVSETGSRLIINRVFKKLLETEKEAADVKSQARTAVSKENYEFELLGQQDLEGRPSYVLRVEPKTDNKFLYRGKIWVDAADFAVAKIEAEPAKRPSFWISKTTVHHTYKKIGEFWLPAQNESNTDVRLGGHAVLSIQYKDYKVIAVTKPPASLPHGLQPTRESLVLGDPGRAAPQN